MKKLIGTLVAAMLAAAVFADVNVGAWGCGIWSPFAYDGDAKMTNSASWGGAHRVGVSLSGSSDNVGFALDVKADPDWSLALNDNAFIWVKPWDFMKLTMGNFFDDTLRGNCGFGSFNWLRPGNAKGEDITFTRVYDTGNGRDTDSNNAYKALPGAELALTPIEGLYIAAAFNIGTGVSREFGDVFKNSQYLVGYTIADILAIKAQYIGLDAKNSFGVINAAVDILAVENNKISVGAFIPTDSDASIDIGATYNGSFDALSLSAMVKAYIARADSENFGLYVGIGIEYGFGEGLAIEADVRAKMEFADDFLGDISVGAYFSKGFSNGKCGVGVLAEFGANQDIAAQTLSKNNVNIAIPIRMEYWF